MDITQQNQQQNVAQPPAMPAKQKIAIPPEVIDKLSSLSTRITIIEENLNRLTERIDLIEQRIITRDKQLNIEMKTNLEEINEIKETISTINDNMSLIISDIKGTARKDETETIKKYLEMWEPMQFLTRKEFKEKIDEIERKIGGI